MSGAETFHLKVVDLDDQPLEFTSAAVTCRERDSFKSWSITVSGTTPSCADQLGRSCWFCAETADDRVFEGCALIESRSLSSGVVQIRGMTPLLIDGQEW